VTLAPHLELELDVQRIARGPDDLLGGAGALGLAAGGADRGAADLGLDEAGGRAVLTHHLEPAAHDAGQPLGRRGEDAAGGRGFARQRRDLGAEARDGRASGGLQALLGHDAHDVGRH
jgi:hypothetical protein